MTWTRPPGPASRHLFAAWHATLADCREAIRQQYPPGPERDAALARLEQQWGAYEAERDQCD